MVSQRVLSAIRTSIELGFKLRFEHPEIREMYRNDMSYSDIAKRLNITELYEVSERVAIVSLSYAIRGCKGGLRIPAYCGLIEDEAELEKLCQSHKSGLESKWEIFREAGLKSVVSRGQVMWSERKGKRLSEIEYLRKLLSSPSFRHHTTQFRGLLNRRLIKIEVNRKYHNGEPIRTDSAIRCAIERVRKLKG